MNQIFDKLNLKPEERRLAVIFLAIFFVFVNYMYVFPKFKELESTQQKTQLAENKLAMYRLKTNQIPTLESTLALLGQKAGPSVQDNPRQRSILSATVDRMARKHEVTIVRQSQIREVSPEPGQTNQFFTELEIPVSIEGTEEQIVNFLFSIGNEDSLIRVRSLTLSPSRRGGLFLAGQLNLVASFLKNEKEENSNPTKR